MCDRREELSSLGSELLQHEQATKPTGIAPLTPTTTAMMPLRAASASEDDDDDEDVDDDASALAVRAIASGRVSPAKLVFGTTNTGLPPTQRARPVTAAEPKNGGSSHTNFNASAHRFGAKQLPRTTPQTQREEEEVLSAADAGEEEEVVLVVPTAPPAVANPFVARTTEVLLNGVVSVDPPVSTPVAKHTQPRPKQQPIDDDDEQQQELLPPLDVLYAALGVTAVEAKELTKRIAEKSPSFRKPTSEETAGYTVALLGLVQNCVDAEKDLKDAPLTSRNKFGVTLLHKACRYPNWEAALHVARLHPDLCSARDDLGRVPLHDACWNDTMDFALVDALLERAPGALLASDGRGHTPLCYVPRKSWGQWNRYVTSRRELIRAGVDDLLGNGRAVQTANPTSTSSASSSDDVPEQPREAKNATEQDNQVVVVDEACSSPATLTTTSPPGDARSFALASSSSSTMMMMSAVQTVRTRRRVFFDVPHSPVSKRSFDDDSEDDSEDEDDGSSSSSSEDSEHSSRNWELASSIAARLEQGRSLAAAANKRRRVDSSDSFSDSVGGPRHVVVSDSDLEAERALSRASSTAVHAAPGLHSTASSGASAAPAASQPSSSSSERKTWSAVVAHMFPSFRSGSKWASSSTTATTAAAAPDKAVPVDASH